MPKYQLQESTDWLDQLDQFNVGPQDEVPAEIVQFTPRYDDAGHCLRCDSPLCPDGCLTPPPPEYL